MQPNYRILLTAASLCAGLLSTTANAALQARLGGQGVYDNDLNITWLTNGNLAASNTFGLERNVDLGGMPGIPYSFTGSIIYSNGSMNWGGAIKWVAAMNAANYLGYNDWRLPTTMQPDAGCSEQYNPGAPYSLISSGINCTGSEMGHLFYSELGGGAWHNIATTHNANFGLFQNILDMYWSSTENMPYPYTYNAYAWILEFSNGYQHPGSKYGGFNVMAVRGGDSALAAPSSVPVPAAAWLLGSGLLGLIGVARHKAA